MDPRLDTSDWGEVFGDAPNGYGCEYAFHNAAVHGDTECSDAPFTREDVAEIFHIDESSDECWAEWSGVCVGRLKDGRFFSASGWCDTSGWG